MIGFHIQNGVPNWLDAVTKLPTGTWVKVFSEQQAAEIKAANPGCKVVRRHWYDHGQIFGGTYEENKQKARVFFNTFINDTFRQYARHIDAIEGWNEYLANGQSQQEIDDRIRWVQASQEVWRTEYRTQPVLSHIRLVSANAAIGNDIPWQMAQAVQQNGGILGYHAYVPVNRVLSSRPDGILPDEWNYYSGRWTVMDAAYRQRGITVQWLFTEGGEVKYYQCGNGICLDPIGGWRENDVCGGDVNRLNPIIGYWMARTKAWNQANGGRALSCVLFTTGGGSQWASFEKKQPELNIIADYVRTHTGSTPPPEPPPPVPPPPLPTSQIRSFEDGHITLNSRLQQPAGFTISVVAQGQSLWYKRNGQTVNATGTVEAKRLECQKQLPPVQCKDGAAPLILDGVWSFKIQAVYMQSGTSLKTTFTGNGRARVTVPINVHWQHDPPNETDDVYAVLLLNGVEVHRLQHPQLKDRQWATLTGEANYPVTAELRFQNSWASSRDCFTDLWRCETMTTQATWNKLVVLLPQGTNLAQYLSIATDVAFTTKTEIAFSADSAFDPPGLVGTHRVIVYDVAQWGGRAALEAWALTRFGTLPTIEYRDF